MDHLNICGALQNVLVPKVLLRFITRLGAIQGSISDHVKNVSLNVVSRLSKPDVQAILSVNAIPKG